MIIEMFVNLKTALITIRRTSENNNLIPENNSISLFGLYHFYVALYEGFDAWLIFCTETILWYACFGVMKSCCEHKMMPY